CANADIRLPKRKRKLTRTLGVPALPPHSPATPAPSVSRCPPAPKLLSSFLRYSRAAAPFSLLTPQNPTPAETQRFAERVRALWWRRQALTSGFCRTALWRSPRRT